MKLQDYIKTAYQGISLHKGRTALTLLGIVIGVASVILILSIGKGAEKLILNEISGFGADTIVLRPGKEPKGPSDLPGTLFADSLKKKDVLALKKKTNVPHLRRIAPAVFVASPVSYRGETYKKVQIFGWSAEFMAEMINTYPEKGVLFSENDIDKLSKVAVIGYKVKHELFGNAEAIGKKISIKGEKFKVVGVLPKKGQVAFFNVDDVVVIPSSTAQKYLLGIDYFHEILMKVDDPKNVEKTVEDVKRTIRESHKIKDPSKDDFFVVTQKGMIKQIKVILDSLTVFLSSVVAISLVVGGIGVMNIMLVSVTERTREIGLRKALGATKRNILFQFLSEAVMLTLFGGLIGVLIGGVLAFMIAYVVKNNFIAGWEFVFPLSALFLALFVSFFVGIIFGIYPAKKASDKTPMEALRYE